MLVIFKTVHFYLILLISNKIQIAVSYLPLDIQSRYYAFRQRMRTDMPSKHVIASGGNIKSFSGNIKFHSTVSVPSDIFGCTRLYTYLSIHTTCLIKDNYHYLSAFSVIFFSIIIMVWLIIGYYCSCCY